MRAGLEPGAIPALEYSQFETETGAGTGILMQRAARGAGRNVNS
jgi:hypothetical protein